jgi:hypothetical protein
MTENRPPVFVRKARRDEGTECNAELQCGCWGYQGGSITVEIQGPELWRVQLSLTTSAVDEGLVLHHEVRASRALEHFFQGYDT